MRFAALAPPYSDALCADWRDIPIDEPGEAALDNIPTRSRTVADYAVRLGWPDDKRLWHGAATRERP